jgi:DNA-binding MarR family transcriptional regulator
MAFSSSNPKSKTTVRVGEDELERAAEPRPVRRNGMDVEDRRNLQALEAISEDGHITQRTLATKLGIALGLTNIYLRRLVRKGYVKAINVQSNRLRYLLTPTGVAEKTRLTYEFMEYSLTLFGQVRRHLRTVLEPALRANRRRIAVYGTGEAAELAYLSITELGLELVAIFDGPQAGRFLGHVVRPIEQHHEVQFDLLLIASLDHPESVVERLLALGIDRDRLIVLRN